MAAAAGPSGLTDTDILIDAAHGLADAVSFLTAQQAAGGIHISAISVMELTAGSRNAGELASIREFLENVQVVQLSETASRTACELMQLFYLGHGLLIPDALIAATALERRLPLYTRNARHFQMIPDLTVIAPY